MRLQIGPAEDGDQVPWDGGESRAGVEGSLEKGWARGRMTWGQKNRGFLSEQSLCLMVADCQRLRSLCEAVVDHTNPEILIALTWFCVPWAAQILSLQREVLGYRQVFPDKDSVRVIQ